MCSRWSGDPCLCAWGGQNHVYSNNTCVSGTDDPVFFDASVEGNQCIFNYSDADTALFLPKTHSNTYLTPNGVFQTGCDIMYDLTELQELGQELGSIVRKGYIVEDIIAQARALLA